MVGETIIANEGERVCIGREIGDAGDTLGAWAEAGPGPGIAEGLVVVAAEGAEVDCEAADGGACDEDEGGLDGAREDDAVEGAVPGCARRFEEELESSVAFRFREDDG